jgi:hypothetical protein
MNFQETIEKIAGREMTEAEANAFAREQWGLVCSWLRENEGGMTGYFPITSVSREDLEGIGYNTKKVEDGTMKQLASKMADAYCDGGYWIDLPIIADHLEIPK